MVLGKDISRNKVKICKITINSNNGIITSIKIDPDSSDLLFIKKIYIYKTKLIVYNVIKMIIMIYKHKVINKNNEKYSNKGEQCYE